EFGVAGIPTTDGRRVISLSELERLRKAGEKLTGTYEIIEDDDMAEILAALGTSGGPSQVTNTNAKETGADYAGDVLSTAREYAKLVLNLCRDKQFDVIHAHDWMTYPAGMALGRVTGKPLVAHIHSTEFDRSGEHVNQVIYDIERRGMHAAVRVIAVSMLTKNIVAKRYGVDPGKIRVVYNGVAQEEKFAPAPMSEILPKDKIVLFLGRITMQKGPEYFVTAAKRVLEKIENVKFVVAGNGDMARKMIEQAAELGIGHKVLFTGFLRGRDVGKVFQMADCYVMPSVSEPFGIAPLEAMSHDTPVIISKQSGVSEVVSHALKVDFWDTDQMANKIIAVLRYPPLSQTLKEHGRMELRRLTWDGAAEKCVGVYEQAIEAVGGRMPAVLPHAG
ncbi:MAG: glycosyltransferase family 4 protein, partial [Phycisphaerales bacterium]